MLHFGPYIYLSSYSTLTSSLLSMLLNDLVQLEIHPRTYAQVIVLKRLLKFHRDPFAKTKVFVW